MKKKKKERRENRSPNCPICGHVYSSYRQFSRHHVFPKLWYHGGGPIAEICTICHREFHKIYQMAYVWKPKDGLEKFKEFCKTKGKDMLKIYPHLNHFYRD